MGVVVWIGGRWRRKVAKKLGKNGGIHPGSGGVRSSSGMVRLMQKWSESAVTELFFFNFHQSRNFGYSLLPLCDATMKGGGVK